MAKGRSVVVTAYGHERKIDRIAVSLFDEPSTGYGYIGQENDSNAKTYCGNINSLELKGDSWVFAKVVPENTQLALEAFIPEKFDLILKLDDRSIQKVMREIDSQDLVKAMKGENEAIQEKIFRNMSNRAGSMLKEDMGFMGPIRKQDVWEAQLKILGVIHHLEDVGEIVIDYTGEGII
jgi:hypothetical protein